MTLHGITVYTVMLALLIVYTSRAQFAAGAGSKAGREYHGGNVGVQRAAGGAPQAGQLRRPRVRPGQFGGGCRGWR